MVSPTTGGLWREYWAPLILWLCLIYLFSSDRFSQSETSRFLFPILNAFLSGWSLDQLELVHGVIRKSGHVVEFGVLGVLAYRAVRLSNDRVAAGLWSALFLLSTAVFDEIHQMLTLYREASPLDVGYDFFGATLGIWICSMVEYRRFRIGT